MRVIVVVFIVTWLRRKVHTMIENKLCIRRSYLILISLSSKLIEPIQIEYAKNYQRFSITIITILSLVKLITTTAAAKQGKKKEHQIKNTPTLLQ